MASSVFSLQFSVASIDYSAVGGWILLLDLGLFTTVASFWEAAGQSEKRVHKRRKASPKR